MRPWAFFLFRLQLIIVAVAASAATNCQTQCGNITIPYPFGIGHPACYRPGFNLTCNHSSTSGPKLYLGDGTFEATEILISHGQVLIKSPILRLFCDPGETVQDSYNMTWSGIGDNGPFTFSADRNAFVTIGCSVISYVTSLSRPPSVTNLCAAVCFDYTSVERINGSCSGMGCCQTMIGDSVAPSDIGSCTKSFLVDRQWFRFNPIQLADDKFFSKDYKVPVVVDWAIPWESADNRSWSCAYAARNQTSYACRSKQSLCVDGDTGYTCECLSGFEGNPYIANGCRDIDECAQDKNPCAVALCTNTLGSYSCHCPKGTFSRVDGDPSSGCLPDKSGINIGIIIGIGAASGFSILSLAIASFLLYKRFQQINSKKHREMCFRRNHGLLLQQLLISTENDVERTKIFTLEELNKATNSFEPTRVLGRGGHGTVYKGILSDQRVVAVKKSEINNQTEIKQFINEVAILSQLNHRNIVKLFGCCLESEVPLLVYEFISGGTLSDHLHVIGNHVSSLSFEDRLRIATEIAGALYYLHSAASISIFHRDIKSSNILLDHNLTVKISDFGTSRSIPSDRTRVTTAVQGTFGYLDPEYYYTGQLTEKSDVYSFGVILVELLTGERIISKTMLKQEKNLAMHFIESLEEKQLFQILDVRIAEEGRKEELEAIAILAGACLRIRGEERPTMKTVELKLNRMIQKKKQKYSSSASQQQKSEECDRFISNISGGSRINGTTRSYSLEEELRMSLNYPR
ncbi:uncharacterized protein A4U43_C08F28570 [Asparagus officinalis]|nr:uncharacterized protein A4U43_C08F28570 [Asparagus officinalis]